MKKYVSLGVMITLLDGKRHTSPELAEKYETSVKTIYRAIESLLEAGMPIRCTQGKGGGYELIETSKINCSFFTMSELSSFISFLKSNKLNINNSQNSINERINSLNDKALATELINESNRFIIDTDNWGSTSIIDKNYKIISDSISSSHKLKIDYLDRKQESKTRIIYPYSLVYKGGSWYVYSFCETRKNFRLFKLSRIKEITQTSLTFEKENLDLSQKPWNKEFKANLKKINIELECNPNLLEEIKEWLGENIKIENICNYNCNDNMVSKRIQANAFMSEGLIHRIMQFGDKIKITNPTELKQAIIDECNLISKNYA